MKILMFIFAASMIFDVVQRTYFGKGSTDGQTPGQMDEHHGHEHHDHEHNKYSYSADGHQHDHEGVEIIDQSTGKVVDVEGESKPIKKNKKSSKDIAPEIKVLYCIS